MMFLISGISWSCSTASEGEGDGGDGDDPPGTDINFPADAPHEKLSDYHLYTGDIKNLIPAQRLLPYDLNTQLFSDYAQKLRLVYVPEGTSITYRAGGAFEFPAGSAIVKNFFYATDFREPSSGRKIIETRLLMLNADGWTAETYVWNDEQTEALRQIAGSTKEVTWIDEQGAPRTANYVIPTKNDCKGCHSLNGSITPLGPEARNLNKIYEYDDGASNQLVRWEESGILEGSPGPDQAPRLPVWDDPGTGTIAERARAYLDVNCANCHNPDGPANNSGLYLEYQEQDPARLGVCKNPVSAGKGSGGFKYNIVPGKPDSSILVYRMEVNDPEVRMPETGRTLMHEEAVALIKEWIEDLDPASCN